MKFFSILALAVPAVVQAIVAFTNVEYVVDPNVPFTLTWSNNTGPVSITLKNGPALALVNVEVLDASDSGSSFTWTPPSTLPSDTYAFEIKDLSTGDTNYSPQWQYFSSTTASASGTASGTASASASGTASASASASATGTTGSDESSTVSGSSSPSGTASSTGVSSSSSSSASTTAATTTATSTPQNTNNGQRYQSPLALILVTVAALLYFN